jgi:hypothetical protein
MRILRLTIKRRWLEMIIKGVKKDEYRDINKYYASRLDNKDYDFIEFYVGGYFGQDMPRAKFKFNGVTKGLGRVCWGAPDYDVYKIHIGDLIEKINI